MSIKDSVISRLLISFACTSLVLMPLLRPVSAHAEELSTYDQNRMLGATTIDWQSTNLREWLNSEKMIVDYTAKKPSYGSESGFLSNQNFSDSERNGVAVTRHGLGYLYSLQGNTSDTMYYSQRSVTTNNYVSNDKVFILHYSDMMNYLEKNKLLLERNTKQFSNTLQGQTNLKDKYEFLVNSGYYNTAYAGTSAMFTSGLKQTSGRLTQNIVPALSLKPDYVLANGKKARDLSIGEMVSFGRYQNETIQWEVINIGDNGSPLLWANRILTRKEYDIEGDINPSTSSYINFPTADVDIFSGNGQAKSRETGKNIDSVTNITLLNPDVLTTPTNEASITLKIKATDTKYGIRRIFLPDGRIVEGETADWTFDKNGEYDILVENTIGVLTVKHVVTKAINTPAEVLITTDKDGGSKWTNKAVNVSIKASNNGVYNLAIKGNREMNYNSASTGRFPDWMPLGGKRLRITGTVRNAITDAQALLVDMNAKIRFRGNYTWYSSSQVGMTYPVIKEFSLKELKEKGEIVIDEIFIMPNNVYSGFYSNISMMDGNTAYMKSPYNYWISDFNYEILDKDDLKIEEITFPDGSKTLADTATYSLVKNGSYTFSAKDSRGKVTSKTIDMAIDMDKPTISISGVQTKTVKEQVLRIETSDALSGIKRVRLPNGEYRSTTGEGQPLSLDYNITSNGEYSFVAEDYAGNLTTQKVTITNVDNQPPVVTTTASTSNWTKDPVTIQISASDAQSGVRFIQMPNGAKIASSSSSLTVSENGTYTFIVEDAVGNQTIKSIAVTNIDTLPPKGTLSASTTSWTNQDVTLTLSAVFDEGGSGVKQIEKPNGSTTTLSTASQIVTANGTYTFKIFDNVGNVSLVSMVVKNIDKESPKTAVTLVPGTTALTIRYEATDVSSGVKSVTLADNRVISGATATYAVTKAGDYTATIEDMLGNREVVTTTIESPSLSLNTESETWTNLPGYNLIVTGKPKYGATLRLQAPFSSTAWINANSLSSYITKNGSYLYVVNDGGIQETVTTEVKNFDRVLPKVILTESTAPSGGIVNIKVNDLGDKKQ